MIRKLNVRARTSQFRGTRAARGNIDSSCDEFSSRATTFTGGSMQSVRLYATYADMVPFRFQVRDIISPALRGALSFDENDF